MARGLEIVRHAPTGFGVKFGFHHMHEVRAQRLSAPWIPPLDGARRVMGDICEESGKTNLFHKYAADIKCTRARTWIYEILRFLKRQKEPWFTTSVKDYWYW